MKKRQPKPDRGELRPEEIFGVLDEALDRLAQQRPAPEKKKKLRPTSLPKMQIRHSELPPEFDKVEASNVVFVPDSELKSVAASMDRKTRGLNRRLLRDVLPLLLSFQTSTTYAKAALKEGLDVEIDFDPGLADCVQHIGYLNVVMHFIRESKLPLSVKRQFMREFSNKLADRTLTSLIETNKAETRRQQIEQLQAVVYSHREKKAEVRSPDSESKNAVRRKKPKARTTDSAVAVKRSRRG